MWVWKSPLPTLQMFYWSQRNGLQVVKYSSLSLFLSHQFPASPYDQSLSASLQAANWGSHFWRSLSGLLCLSWLSLPALLSFDWSLWLVWCSLSLWVCFQFLEGVVSRLEHYLSGSPSSGSTMLSCNTIGLVTIVSLVLAAISLLFPLLSLPLLLFSTPPTLSLSLSRSLSLLS